MPGAGVNHVVDIRWDNLDFTKFMALSVSCNVVVKSIIYPFIVAKTRIQVENNKNGKYSSTTQMLKNIKAAEGMRGVYRGISTAMFGFIVPQGAYIYSYEKIRDQAFKYLQSQSSAGLGETSPVFLANTIGGGCAAIVATLMNTPVDVITQRMQLDGATSRTTKYNYRNGFHALFQIGKTEGIRGLYRGLGATLASFVPSSAIWWAVYGALRSHVYPLVADYGLLAETGGNLACGVLSGWASVCLLNPLDVAKTRLQTQVQHPDNPKNIVSMSWKILRTEGVAAIWVKGLTARMMGTALFSAWTVAMYEVVKKTAFVESSLPPSRELIESTEPL